MAGLNESHLENIALNWFQDLGFELIHGPDIAPDEAQAERADYSQVVLQNRLARAVDAINPHIPGGAREEAIRQALTTQSPSLVGNNHAFHRLLVEGVPVSYQNKEGGTVHDYARLIDFEHPLANDFTAVNQFTVEEGQNKRRPDIVLFINGLPLAVLELKNPASQEATIWTAFNQLQTYKEQIPSLFIYNQVLVISDGLDARVGSLTANKEWFMPWRTIEGENLAPESMLKLEVLVRGLFDKERFLDYIRHFIVFDEDKAGTVKKIAGYHQFHAANRAVETTAEASSKYGDRRAGVVWHTQGSGKSLTMAFYAGKLILHPAMENPTVVVITDRNDLDDQLFSNFAHCHELLRQQPKKADSREHLRDLLSVDSGGVIFTTVHKFFPEDRGGKHPELSPRRNIVVIADEAHRSQYDFIDGFARHMRDALPNASFIGFTGTPIETADKNTLAVFGDHISIYDIQRAQRDGATVPIYYESRLARIELDEREKPSLDSEFEEATEGEELEGKERLKSKWAALESLVGAEKRIGLVARDLVDHWESRLEAMDGKAMIVCMSRRICVDLYNAITKLRPGWRDSEDKNGTIKIVMTGSASDPLDWQEHIRTKGRREELANRFKEPDDPFKIVIVRDMWLTGFDAPCLHTMYVDKPMRGHGLMQAIARVNRVFKDKPGGLVVDYLGIAEHLKFALAQYTQSGGRGKTTVDQAAAVALMLEKHEICCGLFHGFNWSAWTKDDPAKKLALLPAAQEHILGQDKGKERLLKEVSELSKAFALSVPHEETKNIRNNVAFFQAVRAALAKSSPGSPVNPQDMEMAVRQLVSKAVVSDGVLDIYDAAGLDKPDITILSDKFLEEVRQMKFKNLAVETLRKLLDGEIKQRKKKSLVQARSFAEMLEKSIQAYQNRTIQASVVIEELIALAKEMKEADKRGEALNLTMEEVAFYDALETNDSAVKVLGDDNLRIIAKELLITVRKNATIDWTMKESVRAKLRVMVKRILRKHGYPPDKQEKAVLTIIEQAELITTDWAE
ncbi:type I restriction enzyme, R subunit [Desulfatibacillum alkenivorans DSM 16219]|uniref:Type I restriction enzyme endonuclease subunit n=1 Tax=Desulfatibacillum alkenivorans DSM 16219 TaxID=1121393 RepID=A0A1M6RFG5_9BACT|nr:type I restriction endonuclease subunit R [Desulfatibacillum alkenivorans]SHK31214.1 type I restriction enzyme, R subunit [Desulfatibacillum alkenivorans DSM 16219]